MSDNLAAPPKKDPSNPFTDLEQKIEEIFEKADDFMINKKSFGEAAKLYEEIIALDPENIDALNSLA